MYLRVTNECVGKQNEWDTNVVYWLHVSNTIRIVYPSQHADAFWRNRCRWLSKTLWLKEKFPSIGTFLHLSRCCELCHKIIPYFTIIFKTFAYIVKRTAAELLYVGKGLDRIWFSSEWHYIAWHRLPDDGAVRVVCCGNVVTECLIYLYLAK